MSCSDDSRVAMGDFLLATIQHVKSMTDCDCELLAILESHLLKLKSSQGAVATAFEAIQALAEARAERGSANA